MDGTLPYYRQESEIQPITDFRNFIHRIKEDCAMPFDDTVNHFIPEDKLQAELEKKIRTSKILAELCKDSAHDIEPETVYRGRCKIFAIFLLIGRGRDFLYCANKSDMMDNYLPFSREPKGFPQNASGSCYREFEKKQWEFVPLDILPGFWEVMQPQRQLPLISMNQIGSGVSSQTYRVEVYPHYDKIYDGKQVFAMKVSGNREMQVEASRKELEAVFAIRNRVVANTLPIVHHHSTFFHKDRFFSFQEHANGGDLGNFFKTNHEHISPDSALRLWNSMMNLLDGLDHIHQHVADRKKTGSRFFYGWHQDIKPSNILVFNYDAERPELCCFKLADFGLSRFQPSEPDPDATKNMLSRTYSPPPTQQGSREPPPQAHDVWALGCVFSIFAAWIDSGAEGILNYKYERVKEIEKRTLWNDKTTFHDGTTQLECVRAHHSHLEREARFESTMYAVRDVIRPMFYYAKGGASADHHKVTWLGIYNELKQGTVPPFGGRDTSPRSEPGPSRPRPLPHPDHSGHPSEDVRAKSEVTEEKTETEIWSFEKAQEWKNDPNRGSPPISPVRQERLRRRDYVILIDDGAAMRLEWPVMIKWLRFFIWLLFYLRVDNKIDYNFFHRQRSKLSITESTQKQEIDRMKASCPPDADKADPGDVLNKLLATHGERSGQGMVKGFLNDAKKLNKHKPLSIFILTSASWSINQTESAIMTALKHHPKLRGYNGCGMPYVSIQFIQFGNSSEGRMKLNCLDNLKMHEAEADIVDTVAYNGCVDKMLFGSLDREEDEKGEGFGHDCYKAMIEARSRRSRSEIISELSG